MEPLFHESTLALEKISSEVTLPDDPNQWPTEILQELYKSVPYVADFDPDIIMDRVDAEKRYGFGHIEVANKSEIQESPSSPTAQAAGIRHVRIPIIIREGKLLPFDIIVTDTQRILPLTERRLRQALFRPQLFDVTSRTPGDQSMISQLYPPYRQNYGFGGGGSVMTAGMGKEGQEMRGLIRGALPPPNQKTDKQDHTPGEIAPVEKTGSLLEAVLGTINPSDYQRFVRDVNEGEVKIALHQNKLAIEPALSVLAQYEPPSQAERSSKLAAAIRPSVVQLTHLPGVGYRMKTASHKMWQPIEKIIDRGELLRKFGADTAMEVEQHGSVTGGEADIEADLPEKDQPSIISEYGIYKVQDTDGRQLIGFVFPNLLDLDGTALPLALFTNGSQSAMQGEIVGVRVSEGAALIEGPPRGHGIFYTVMPNGKAVATIPLDIQAGLTQGEEAGGGGASLMASSPLHGGQQVQVALQPNLKTVTQSGDAMLIPDDWHWMPLEESDSVALVDKPDGFEQEMKTAGKVDPLSWIELRAGGADSFTISGIPVEKLADDQASFLSLDDALFLMVGLGIAPKYGIQKMGEALNWNEPVRIRTSRNIDSADSVLREISQKVAQNMSTFTALRHNLVKESAFVPDPSAVDTILSLGFVNSENILTFISYMPAIDEAQGKLCELLLASRLGVQDLNDAALERSIRGVETALEGLRTLAFQSN
jgi:hypothetical protein